MAELAHVNRFSTAGELTASIAHEINQPLGAILTNAETAEAILKSPSPDIAELNEIVDDILQDDRRASEVIRRMRSLLKKAPFELKNLDLNDVVRETVEFLSSLAVGRKVELTSVITPDALPILGDRIQLQQVILNLVVNGIDAMKDTPSRKPHHQHSDFARREVCRAIRVGSRPGHSRRQIERGLRTVLHQQGGRHGHGAVHRAHHYRGAQWADMGKKSGSRRRVVPDQASSCLIVGDPWHDFHSDYNVAQLEPLHMVQDAASRVMNEGGEVLNIKERIPVVAALKAVTIDAAWQCRMDNIAGSLEVGKYADLAILEKDPTKVDLTSIKAIKVSETWLGGVKQ